MAEELANADCRRASWIFLSDRPGVFARPSRSSIDHEIEAIRRMTDPIEKSNGLVTLSFRIFSPCPPAMKYFCEFS